MSMKMTHKKCPGLGHNSLTFPDFSFRSLWVLEMPGIVGWTWMKLKMMMMILMCGLLCSSQMGRPSCPAQALEPDGLAHVMKPKPIRGNII
ncbi:hypothetical protein CDL15_Pgr007703 [Punica granatum]|uniref:Uncharacterized protein n=1 Tax=Punica granatum TaxID=22663 RepID=A0A218X8X3_PUNGR|nr:hypothetical protein CDL15_Pgr007703 [Punica granatum]